MLALISGGIFFCESNGPPGAACSSENARVIMTRIVGIAPSRREMM
jgi:hypothetical protein